MAGATGALELLRGTSRRSHRRAPGVTCALRAPGFTCALRAPGGGRVAGGGLLPHPGLDLRCQARVLAQIVAHVLPALAQTLVAVRHPGAALFEDAVLNR